MTAERPSNALIVLLTGSLLLAGWVYVRPLLTRATEPDDAFIEPDTIGFVDDEGVEAEAVERWIAPDTPRNPFLPIDTGTPPAPTSREASQNEPEDDPGQDPGGG